jgi:hypothetical protein
LWLQKKATTNSSSPLSFVAVFGSGIRDPEWIKVESVKNIPDPQHCYLRISKCRILTEQQSTGAEEDRD